MPPHDAFQERSMAKESFLIDGETITVRMSSAALKALDDWRQKQTDSPGRAEAICRLVGQPTSANARPTADESQFCAINSVA
jgi:hypothetical protein